MICHYKVLPKLPEVCLTLQCLPLQVAARVYTETKEGFGITFAPKSQGNEIKSILHACHCLPLSQPAVGSSFYYYYCYYYYHHYYHCSLFSLSYSIVNILFLWLVHGHQGMSGCPSTGAGQTGAKEMELAFSLASWNQLSLQLWKWPELLMPATGAEGHVALLCLPPAPIVRGGSGSQRSAG